MSRRTGVLSSLILVFSLCVFGLFPAVASAATKIGLTSEYEPYFDGSIVRDWDSSAATTAWPGMSVPRHAHAYNKGGIPMRARMRYEAYWVEPSSDDGWVQASGLNSSFIEVTLANPQLWEDGGDGWYYYKDNIQPGATTEDFISSMSISKDVDEDINGSVEVNSAYVGKGAVVDVYLECSEAERKAVPADEPSAPSIGRLAQTDDIVLPWEAFAVIGGIVIALGLVLVIVRRRSDKDEESR